MMEADNAEPRVVGLSRGEKLTQLMLGSSSWVHRRVDTLQLGTEGETRRSVSLDVTVPSEFAIEGSENRIILPLALIEKATLRSFDTSDASGHPMSVLGTAENSRLALDLLKQLVPDWIRDSEALHELCLLHLQRLVYATRDSAPEAEESFVEWVTQISAAGQEHDADLAVFVQFAVRLAANFLLLVEVDSKLAGTRTVMKYSHDLDAPDVVGGTLTAGFKNDVPDFGFAASQHLEVRLPAGLIVGYMALVELDPQGTGIADDEDDPARERAVGHVALSPGSRFSSALLTVEVVPSRQGILTFTCWATVLVGVAVVAALAVKQDLPQAWFHLPPALMPEAKIPSPSASILLIGPALMLSWLGRTPEHDLTVVLLSPLRKILLLCALVLLLMAGAAAIPLSPPFWHTLWAVVSGVMAWAGLWLVYFVFDVKRRLAAAGSEKGQTQPLQLGQTEGDGT